MDTCITKNINGNHILKDIRISWKTIHMEQIISNIPCTEINKMPKTPDKPVAKPPIENIITLLEHIVQNRRRKLPLMQKLNLLTDKDMTDIDVIEEIEKVEEEIDFINKYTDNLESQAVVIMNEHNVKNIPSLESIEKMMLLKDDQETSKPPL